MSISYNFLSRLFRSIFIRKEFFWFLRLSLLRLKSGSYKNFYYNKKLIIKNLNKKNFYKDVVGGDWDRIGNLQLSYLISQNLKKNHKLLDIGCGTLRGGVKFCEYLDKNNYYGFDKLESFLKIGYEKEIIEKDLQKKLNYKNLKFSSNFDFSYPLDFFDYALSISLFTHLPIEDLEICLKKLNPFLKKNSCYYSTFFLTDNKFKKTNSDPYYHLFDEIDSSAKKFNYQASIMNDFNHPRNQKMIKFKKLNAI